MALKLLGTTGQQKVSIATNSALNLPDGDWALSYWYKYIPSASESSTFYIHSYGGLWKTTPSLNLQTNTPDATAFPLKVLAHFGAIRGANGVDMAVDFSPGGNSQLEGRWQHVLFQRVSNRCQLWHNGFYEAQDSDVSNVDAIDPSTPWNIGYSPEETPYYTSGLIAEFALFRHAIGDADIDENVILGLSKGRDLRQFDPHVYVPFRQEDPYYSFSKESPLVVTRTNAPPIVWDHPPVHRDPFMIGAGIDLAAITAVGSSIVDLDTTDQGAVAIVGLTPTIDIGVDLDTITQGDVAVAGLTPTIDIGVDLDTTAQGAVAVAGLTPVMDAGVDLDTTAQGAVVIAGLTPVMDAGVDLDTTTQGDVAVAGLLPVGSFTSSVDIDLDTTAQGAVVITGLLPVGSFISSTVTAITQLLPWGVPGKQYGAFPGEVFGIAGLNTINVSALSPVVVKFELKVENTVKFIQAVENTAVFSQVVENTVKFL